MCARQTQPAYAYNLCAATLCPADATVLVPVPSDNMALSPLVKPGTLKKSGVVSSGSTTTSQGRAAEVIAAFYCRLLEKCPGLEGVEVPPRMLDAEEL